MVGVNVMRMTIIATTRYYETSNGLKKKLFFKNYYVDCLTKLGVLLIPIISENDMVYELKNKAICIKDDCANVIINILK